MRPILVSSRRGLVEVNRPHALVSFHDPGVTPADSAPRCVRRLDVEVHDVPTDSAELPGPTAAVAGYVCAFVAELPPELALVVQCEAGVGRSVATAAALLRHQGADRQAEELLDRGTHNRTLYRLLCAEMGLAIAAEPLVALAVRVKYDPDRAFCFLKSLQRQRYDNWFCVFVTDGPNDRFLNWAFDRFNTRVEILETPERRKLWGHPYRQTGIDRCLERGAEVVGINNDDNYLTPGYLEQMVRALERDRTDLVLCPYLHAYRGWAVVGAAPQAGTADVGNWLARAELVRRVPWDGYDFAADGRYVERLAAAAGRVSAARAPLFVKN